MRPGPPASWPPPVSRSMMLDYLNKRTSELLLETAEQNAGQNPLVIVDRLLRLKQEMSLRDRARRPTAYPEKQWLQDHNQAYLHALGRGDPSVFVARHPDLFLRPDHQAGHRQKR